MKYLSSMPLWFDDKTLAANVVSTGMLLIFAAIVRTLARRTVARWELPNQDARRRWLVQSRNATLLLVVIGLLFIWGPELKTFAISLVAIAAAVVVGLKEIIMCALGGVLRASSNMYTIGDRIEIAGIRGDVLDYNLVATNLLEVGPGREFHQFTGRRVALPHSLLLAQPVTNETQTGTYVLHTFRICFKRSQEWKVERQALLDAARLECGPYVEGARIELARLGRREGFEPPSVEPRISIVFPEPDRVDLVLRVPTPAKLKGRVEQAILQRYAGLIEA